MIQVKNIMEGRSLPDAGSELFIYIEQALKEQRVIELDLTGVDALPSMFLNTSLGRAMQLYGAEKVVSLLVVRNTTKVQVETLKRYITNIRAMYPQPA